MHGLLKGEDQSRCIHTDDGSRTFTVECAPYPWDAMRDLAEIAGFTQGDDGRLGLDADSAPGGRAWGSVTLRFGNPEIAGPGVSLFTGVGPTLAYRRRYVWHKQEMFKGRNVFYGNGWGGWGFESNVVASVANAAPNAVLRAAPIFEKGPPGMYTNSVPQTLQNKLNAYAIPALSPPAGVTVFDPNIVNRNTDMSNLKENGWCRWHKDYKDRWLHSDIQNVAYYYTHRLFNNFCEQGELR